MGFFAPWFLAGLAVLGVPVFVHLLKRHVAIPRPVSSLMFFERGTQSSTRHRRLKHLLLFALRFALILLLVLAFANPYAKRAKADVDERLLLVVVDQSYSMQAGSRWTQAKQQAQALLSAKSKSQKAELMLLGSQLSVITQATQNADELRAAIDTMEAGDGRASFGELSRGLRTIAETYHRPIELHLFSDLQRTAMPANFAEMVMPQNVMLTLHTVADRQDTPNWTIESVEAPAELPDPKDARRSRVRAVVAGFGTLAASKLVSLLINGKVVATRMVQVPAAGRVSVDFAPLAVGYGLNRCELRVEGDDAFPADDVYHFAVRRSDPKRVLFVHRAGDARSTLYFGTALAAASQGAYLMQNAVGDQTAGIDPERFAFVVLSDVGALSPLFARALEQYVSKGGSVLVALGTGAARTASIPLWAGVVQGVKKYAAGNGFASVGSVDFTHPALQQGQPGQDSGGWADAKVFYAATVAEGQSRVAARLGDGTPMLLDRQLGEGHVLLLTTGLDNLTNDLPVHPVFVVFVDHVARYLSRSDRLSGSRLVDSYIDLRSASASTPSQTNVEVLDPYGHRPLSLTELRTARSIPLKRAGFYQVRMADGRDALIGVNGDRRESDLATMPDDLQKLWSGSGGELAVGATEATRQVAPNSVRVSLWWYVMLLALGVALAERILSAGYVSTQREET